MVRVLVLWFLSIFAASSVSAQSDAEKKRSLHVPYVRAATDCIAAVVRRDDQFDFAVSSDSFRPTIGRALPICQQPIAQMISMHDTIYGTGGQAFFAGPYLDDVERAVRARLTAQIAVSRSNMERAAAERAAADARAQADRQIADERARAERAADAARAEAERIEAETRAKTARAEKLDLLNKTRDLIRAKALTCIGKEGATMLLTDEKADVVAKAAMIFCQSDIDALVRITTEIVEAETGTSSNRPHVREAAETRVRDVVTAYVIRSRGDLIGRNLQQSAPTPSASPRNSPTL